MKRGFALLALATAALAGCGRPDNTIEANATAQTAFSLHTADRAYAEANRKLGEPLCNRFGKDGRMFSIDGRPRAAFYLVDIRGNAQILRFLPEGPYGRTPTPDELRAEIRGLCDTPLVQLNSLQRAQP